MEHLNLEQNFHKIAAAFRMRLINAATASHHAKFYSLCPGYSQPAPYPWLRYCF